MITHMLAHPHLSPPALYMLMLLFYTSGVVREREREGVLLKYLVVVLLVWL